MIEEFNPKILDEPIKELIEAVGRKENIVIEEIKGHGEVIHVRGGGKEFILLPYGEKQGERLAKEILELEGAWEQAVESGDTTKESDEWIEEVLMTCGWAPILNSVEGARYAKTDSGKEVVYYSW